MSNNTPNRGNNMPSDKEEIASQADLIQYENESDQEFQARVDAHEGPTTPTVVRE